jgi:hypothetical protein
VPWRQMGKVVERKRVARRQIESDVERGREEKEKEKRLDVHGQRELE